MHVKCMNQRLSILLKKLMLVYRMRGKTLYCSKTFHQGFWLPYSYLILFSFDYMYRLHGGDKR